MKITWPRVTALFLKYPKGPPLLGKIFLLPDFISVHNFLIATNLALNPRES